MENQKHQEACQCDLTCQCNKKNIYWTCILLIVIAVLLTSAICFYLLKEKESSSTQTGNNIPTENQTISQTTEEPKIEEPIIEEPKLPIIEEPMTIPYRHSTYGFSLIFPATWQGYTSTARTIDWGSPVGTTDSIDFGFPAQDSIFNISIFTPAQWNALQSLGGPMPSYLGQNSQYIFAYDMSQFAANEEMALRRTEISNITKTFQLQ